MKDRVCTSCKFVGKPVKQCYESFLVDAFIWGIVGSGVLVTGLWPALAIPVAWTLYHLAKFKTTKCPQCGELEMVSMNSQKGRKALDKDANQVKVWVNTDTTAAAK